MWAAAFGCVGLSISRRSLPAWTVFTVGYAAETCLGEARVGDFARAAITTHHAPGAARQKCNHAQARGPKANVDVWRGWLLLWAPGRPAAGRMQLRVVPSRLGAPGLVHIPASDFSLPWAPVCLCPDVLC